MKIINKQSDHEVLDGLLPESDLPINLSHWESAMNLDQKNLLEDIVQKQILTKISVNDDLVLFRNRAQEALSTRVVQCLAKFHVDEPDEPGLAVERLRRMSAQGCTSALF